MGNFREIKMELSQNTRLRLGVWCIMGIVFFYVTLLKSESLEEAKREFGSASKQFSKAELLLAQKNWVTLLDSEENSFGKLSESFWQAETKGLAQAKLQGALNEMISDRKFRNPRFRVGVAQLLDGTSDIWQVQIQLDARYASGDELDLLYKIARHPNKMTIDRLDLNSNNSRIILLASAYFIGLVDEDGK